MQKENKIKDERFKLIETVMDKVVNVRDYTNDSIDDEIMNTLFKAFGYGPSVANHQPWEIMLLDKNNKRE